MKKVTVDRSQSDVQIATDENNSWVRRKHMELAIDDCSTLKIRGTEKEFNLVGKPLKTDSEVKDLGRTVDENLSGTAHINNKLKKVNGEN